MKRACLLPPDLSLWLAAAVMIGAPIAATHAQAPGAPAGLDEQQAQQALTLFNAGDYQQAVTLYEGIPEQFPTSAQIPEANFRVGYIYLLLGEYDKSIAALEKNAAGKNVPAAILELSASLVPQVFSAKAGKLPADAPERKDALAEAIKQFDAFLAKFPQSEEVESANFGKARAHYLLQEYEEAGKVLRANLKAFAQSPSVQDTQFMLAAVLATQANTAMQKATASETVSLAAYDEAERLLRDIIQKRTDVALVNDAHFQLGETLAARGGFTNGPKQEEFLTKALEHYRAVLPKELVVKAQEDRLNLIKDAITAAGVAKDLTRVRRAQSFQKREIEKLNVLKQRGDQTIAAKIKSAQVFIARERYDEARVLLRFADGFTEDPEQKKQTFYLTTVTYAAQHIADKAVEAYEKFRSAHPGDPLGENLPLLIGAIYLDPDPALNNPEKAITYFRQQVEFYPKSRYAANAVAQEAEALRQLKRYDEAIATLTKFLATNPTKDLAAAAEFSLGTIYLDTQKTAEAIKTYQGVRDKYAGQPEAERAAFWVGQITLTSGDAKTALTELTSFVQKFPDGELTPAAMLYIGQAQAQLGQKDAALKSYKELAEKHPQSEPAPATFFQRASLHQADSELDKVREVMAEFIAKYPESDRLYAAYDYVAQIQVSQKQPMEAIASYQEFIDKHPEHPSSATAYLKISGLWKTYTESQGAYLTLNDEKREEWKKGLKNSIAAAEQAVEKYPESPEVALALQGLLAAQRMQLKVKLTTETDVDKYFQEFAKRFEAQAATRNKILFALAGFVAEKDATRASELMQSAYDPNLIYAPADLDLYGSTLIQKKKLDEALKVYEKLASDTPIPAGSTAAKASRGVQDAQSVALFGRARILQEQGKPAEAGKLFEELKGLYPWSPKLLEANYGIAAGLFEAKQYDGALKLLGPVAKATHASTNLRARAMMLVGRISQAQGNTDAAINNYVKIGSFFKAESALAAEGLWLGAQLMEQKANQ